jgi:hypothetical protein
VEVLPHTDVHLIDEHAVPVFVDEVISLPCKHLREGRVMREGGKKANGERGDGGRGRHDD